MRAPRKAKILRLTAGGLFLGVCLYLLGYIALRRSGFLGLNYPLAYLNKKLLADHQLVLSDQSKGAGNMPLVELRGGVLIPMRLEDDPKLLRVRFYAPLIKLEFRNKRNHLENEEYFGVTLSANNCKEALARLLKRDTGLDGWKVTEGSGRYYKSEFSHGVQIVGTLNGANADQLIRKLSEVSDCTSINWGRPDESNGWPDTYYSHWEQNGMRRPNPGTKVALISRPPDEPDNSNDPGPHKSWLLFLEGHSVRIFYWDGWASN